MSYGIERGFGYPHSPRPLTICDVAEELCSARDKFPPLASPHEGYAVLLEEVDELWEAIRANKDGCRPSLVARENMRREAIQIAAMAVRFVEDVCGDCK